MSRNEWRQTAQRGQDRLSKMAAGIHDISALHGNYGQVTEHAHAATREPWGAPYNPRTAVRGELLRNRLTARFLTATSAAQIQVGDVWLRRLKEKQFAGRPELSRGRKTMVSAACLVSAVAQTGNSRCCSCCTPRRLHDVTKQGLQQIDPVVISGDPSHKHRQAAGERVSQELSAASRATGGAYSFHTGNGVYPPHVKNVYTPPRSS